MADDPNTVVFSRPTPGGDRIAFAVCGVAALVIPFAFIRGIFDSGFDRLAQLDHLEIGLLATFTFAGLSFLALALWGGTSTVTFNRTARTLREVAKRGPFTAVDKTIAFKELGDPTLRVDRSRFIVDVPVRDQVAVQIGIYPTQADAEDALRAVNAALDGEEQLVEPVSPLAINPLKAAALAARGPIGL